MVDFANAFRALSVGARTVFLRLLRAGRGYARFRNWPRWEAARVPPTPAAENASHADIFLFCVRIVILRVC